MTLGVKFVAERMYEASFTPELWIPLLDELAIATDSDAGGIGIYWPRPRGIRTTFEISPGKDDWEQSPSQRARWVTYVRANGYINRGFFQLDPYNGDWSDIPDFEERISRHMERGFGVQLGTIIELFNGEIITLEFTRRLGKPRYRQNLIAALNNINTSFMQAAFFASRLHFERACSCVQVLNSIGLPAALLDDNRNIIFENENFDEVGQYFYRSPSGQLSLRGGDALRKSFAHALEISSTRSINISVPVQEFRNPCIIKFMPLHGNAKSIFSKSGTIMVITPVATTLGVPSSEIVSSLFRLTPAEAQLAVALTSGLSLRDCAANQGITIGTSRAYLNSVFFKTRTKQQSELVSLLKSIPLGV